MTPDPDMVIEEALFDAAVQLPDHALRRAFLDKTCASDPALRTRLDELLSAHFEADDFFNFPPPAATATDTASGLPPAAADAPAPATPPVPGSDPVRIGRYQIIRRLGEGGCGVVYLAEQEEPVRRQVALKIIRLGMDTERVIARFALERQALAIMNHPHIARVFDAGATDAGRPYFAMELVTGERITTYCDTRRLTVRERLELFIHVCQAVQHAHQKGILHRDLKPSNVLVTRQDGAPSPKVIDFGVAKAVSADNGDDSVRTLAPDQFIGTPAYMSPEQAEPGRADVDTRTDIYSLGALLYELLTGRPPFDSKKLMASGLDALRRTLREVAPPVPSALLRGLPAAGLAALAARYRCAPDTLVSTLRHDLDWVVMRALEKDRARRYVTVQGLTLDLRHYLDHEPVTARPPSLLYQCGKLVRRYRLAFAAGAAILVALLGGLGTSTVLYLRERAALQEQTRLRAVAEDAERISTAVFLSRENRMDEANALLAGVSHPPDHPSFEGLTAYRTVGNWLAEHRRWSEAADRFAVVERVGGLDAWNSVTLDHQSYGVVLLMSGNRAGYETFSREHAERFAKETNGDAVGRVLKTCLLTPPSPAMLDRLKPLGVRVEHWFAAFSPKERVGWAVLPVALWRYRTGDAAGARDILLRDYQSTNHTSARVASIRAILALCALRDGHTDQARSLVATARADIASKMNGDLSVGDSNNGFWYDWAFADILTREAAALASSAPAKATSARD